jgi:aminotransferase in exopolysaccharide biosynthesis
MTLSGDVVQILKTIAGPAPVALHEPTFSGNEWKYVKDCLDSTFVSSVGEYVERFENEIAEYTGAKYAISVMNGTSALHVALLLAGVKQNDEVLIPALTFVATANSVMFCSAFPHFIDSEESSLGIDVDKLRDYLNRQTEQIQGSCVNKSTGRVIRALVPMHTFGHPSDIEGLLSIAKDFNIALVEDAAEALGSYYQNKHVGTFGTLGILSFNGNKIITTGGGGIILTNDHSLAIHAKHLTTTGKIPHLWEYRHDEVAYNYRMPNLNAALGCAQLERIEELVEAKRELHLRYLTEFSKLEGVRLYSESEKCRSNYWLQTLILDQDHAYLRDEILGSTNSNGYMTRPTWELLNQLKPYTKMPLMDISTSESLSKRIINIPSSSNLVGAK